MMARALEPSETGRNILDVTLEGKDNATACITNPNTHTQNKTMASGTIFAISYTSDIIQVTEDNLVVFTVHPLFNCPQFDFLFIDTASKRGWVANGCGQPNMCMQPFRCKVTGQAGTQPVSRATAPAWCEGNQSQRIGGAERAFIPQQSNLYSYKIDDLARWCFYGQLERNNVDISGLNSSGQPKAPIYDTRMGYTVG
ncbi:hypothetical protein BDN70DRAFT_975465, partial [Pholiota conissans]